MDKADLASGPRAFTSAFHSINTLAIVVFPLYVAIIRGVVPSTRAFGLAPLCSSNLVISTCSDCTADQSGVCPIVVYLSTATLGARRRAATTASCPFRAATCKGVSPEDVTFTSAPARTNSLTTAGLSQNAAASNAVLDSFSANY